MKKNHIKKHKVSLQEGDSLDELKMKQTEGQGLEAMREEKKQEMEALRQEAWIKCGNFMIGMWYITIE